MPAWKAPDVRLDTAVEADSKDTAPGNHPTSLLHAGARRTGHVSWSARNGRPTWH